MMKGPERGGGGGDGWGVEVYGDGGDVCVAMLEGMHYFGGCSRTRAGTRLCFLHCFHHHPHEVAAVSVAVLALHAVGRVACRAKAASHTGRTLASFSGDRATTYSGHVVRAHFEALAVERVAEGPKV
jgi:hypothetical protein